MTATMSQSVDLLTAMSQSGARAVAAEAGTAISAGQPVTVPVETALGVAGNVIYRSQLSDGRQTAYLTMIVPSSGLVSADAVLDAARLATAHVEGAITGLGQAGGPILQFAPPQLVSARTDIDMAGAEAIGFDLQAGVRIISVIWVVEATLGSLLGGSIPVDGASFGEPSVAPATLPELNRATVVGRDHDIHILSDVLTNVSVEVARGSVQVRELTSMTPGTVFELDREVGDPVDVLVNGAIVAQGDIVVVGNQLGIRISQIVEPK